MHKSDTELNRAFIIAEVGQNHQGDPENALEYINVFSAIGADAVKFQKRDNKTLFSADAYSQIYNGHNSFGRTYGEHREALELDPGFMRELKSECRNNNVAFMATPFDEVSLDVLLDNGVDILKIASFDLGNLPFIAQISRSGLPIVLSVGGGQIQHIRSSYETIKSVTNAPITILHCVSEYPCDYDRLGLRNIPVLKEHFPDVTIGLSDHFNGTLSGPIGYLMGARTFEKHVTFNRSLKGTDHSFALEPEGFRKFVRDIHRTPQMLPTKNPEENGQESVFMKLGKAIVAKRSIKPGELFTEKNIVGIIQNSEGIPIREISNVLGKRARSDVEKGDTLSWANVDI
jgi:N-acetylneuraminate synthase/sialic acid synthase